MTVTPPPTLPPGSTGDGGIIAAILTGSGAIVTAVGGLAYQFYKARIKTTEKTNELAANKEIKDADAARVLAEAAAATVRSYEVLLNRSQATLEVISKEVTANRAMYDDLKVKYDALEELYENAGKETRQLKVRLDEEIDKNTVLQTQIATLNEQNTSLISAMQQLTSKQTGSNGNVQGGSVSQ